tara:strand:+ start:1709 stop:3277 length:1569 start_codon:yes stop_codon:yes gene_type:complete
MTIKTLGLGDDAGSDDYYYQLYNSPTEKVRRAKEKEKEAVKTKKQQAAIKKQEDEEAKRQETAQRVLIIAKKDGIPVSEAEKKLAEMNESTKAAPETDTTGLTFATQAQPPEEQQGVDPWAMARGETHAGQARLESAAGAQADALRAKAAADQKGLDKVAGQRVTDAEDYKREMGVLTGLQKAHKAGLDDYQEGTQRLEDDYNDRKIDPNRAFSSTGARVASAIAIALGAFAQGASRGRIPNTAFEIIEGAIKRDIDAQKTEMQKSKNVLLNRNNIYARMMSRFNNEEVAYAATMTMGLKHAKMKVEAMIGKHKSANAQLGLEVILRGIDVKIAEGYQKGGNLRAEIWVKQAQFQAKSGAAQTKRSNSTNLALKTIALLPRLQQGFLSVSAMQGAWATVLPHTVKSWFSGMKEEITYENSKNLNAKALTKAFDGGRPTEKDFQIFVQMFPVSSADKDVGIAQFNNIKGDLTAMIVDKGGLTPNILTEAYEKKTGKAVVVGAVAAELFRLSEEENWDFKQTGN